MINGIINVYKEKGYTSHDVVAKLRGILKQKKIGHTGTLDPNATGVLPLLIGKGTRLSKYLVNHDKIYKTTLKLGIKTDTADITGNIIDRKEVSEDIFVEEKINKILASFKRRTRTNSTNVFGN